MSNKMRKLSICLLQAACLICLLAIGGALATANAATLTVTKTADTNDGVCDADCSLREAIAAANATASDETITFQLPSTDAGCASGICTITMTSGELSVNSSWTAGSLIIYNHTGAQNLVVSGNNQSRIFHITAGDTNLTLDGLTLANGRTSINGGGAIFNRNGTLTLQNCRFTNNISTGFGNFAGAIENYAFAGATAELNIINCTFDRNQSSFGGGAIRSQGGGGNGGGTATLNIVNSTFSQNNSQYGGAISVYSISGLSKATVINSTFAENSASSDGNSFYVYSSDAFNNSTLYLKNTILSSAGNNIVNDNSTSISLGNNLSSDAAGGDSSITPGGYLNQSGDIRNTDARLAPLGYYGGQTLMHALLSGSPAINAGTTTGAPAADQRGAPRVGAVDIGAFELNNSANGGNYKAVLPAGRQAELYGFQITRNGGSFAYSVSAGALPAGVNLSVSNGAVSLAGTPTENGTFDFSLTASDGTNTNVTDYSLQILPPLDSTPPVITPTVTGTLGSNGWYVSNVQISWSVADDESSITGQTGCETQNVTVDTSGTTFICTASSSGGTGSQSVTVKRDASAPSIAFAARTPPNANGWNNANVEVSWNCDDALSGVVASSINQIISAEGANQSAMGVCTDNAGNFASNVQSEINIDKTAPSINFDSRTPAANANGWNNTNVTLRWSCSDALSGADNATVTQIFGTEGANQPINGTCTDMAGNTISDEQGGINIDKTAPTIDFASRTPANANGWNNSDVTLNWNCADALSGASGSSVTQTVSTEGANQSATGACTDLAGNMASDTRDGINIDKTAPVIAFASRTAANAAGWNNSDVAVNWSCADALSGTIGSSISQTISSEGANQTATGICADKAGNAAQNAQSGISIDKTAPTLAPVVTPNPVLLGGLAMAAANAADALSGVASQSCAQLATGAVGYNTGTCTTTDRAGNATTASAEYQVIYDFRGFSQPIANLPAINEVNAGQAVPIKFSLNGNKGLNIFAAGYPASSSIPCDASVPSAVMQPISTPGSSGLSYTAGTDQYGINWKTDKAWKGTCRMLIVKLNDGAERFAKFNFR